MGGCPGQGSCHQPVGSQRSDFSGFPGLRRNTDPSRPLGFPEPRERQLSAEEIQLIRRWLER
jgi:hypothetical protein